jgi:hypothetical protein
MDCDATSPKITHLKAQREVGSKKERKEGRDTKTLTNQN